MKKRFLSIILLCSMVLTLLPTQALGYFVAGKDVADESYTGEIPVTYEDGSTGTLDYDETWEEKYPYGAFAFGTNEAAAGEDPADGGNTVTIPVYRLGGTEGRATVYIRYQPLVSQDGEESLTYAYAASGRDDLTIQVEDPQPIAQYQPLGEAHIYAGCDLTVTQGVTKEVDEETGRETWVEADYQVISLDMDDQTGIEDYVWQLQILGIDDSDELYISQEWTDVLDAVGSELEVPNDIWYADDAIYDFRCIYISGGKTYCTSTALEIPFEETTEELPEMPSDIELNAAPTYTTLTFDEEYDICDFELTFAEGEWVKNIIITVQDDDAAELPEMGLFTLTGNEGGDICQLAATMTILINDNDPFEPSQLGFTVSAVEADQDDGVVTVTVQRTGGLSYPVSVSYEAVSGTAQAGRQFSGVSGTLMFAGDVDSIDISIPLIAEEERAEPLEFTVVLSELQGGTQDELCSFTEDTVTVTLTSSGKAVGLGAGLNLASVLATASGEDVSGNGMFGSSLLPETVTITGTQNTAVASTIVSEYVEGSNARTYTYSSGVQLRRGDKYEGYWTTWENAVGDSIDYDASCNDKYYSKFTTPEFVESDTTPSKAYVFNDDGTYYTVDSPYMLFEQSASQISLWHNNTAYPGSVLTIDKGSYLFSRAKWLGEWPHLGATTSGRDQDEYLYVMPYIWIGNISYTSNVINVQKWWTGNCGTIPVNGSPAREHYMSDSYDISMDDGTIKFGVELSTNYNGDDQEWGMSVSGTDDYWVGTKSSSDVRLTGLYFERRVFTNTSTLGLKVHTANDADLGLDSKFAVLDESIGVYDSMKPTVTLVPGKGGVTTDGNLYVGSTLEINLTNTKSYYTATGEKLDFTLYLTDSDGNVINVPVDEVSSDDDDDDNNNSSKYTMKLLWDGMTEADLSKSYTINVVMERRQTITLDISTSLSNNPTLEEIAKMWKTVTGNSTQPFTYGWSETVDRDTSSTHFQYHSEAKAWVPSLPGTKLELKYGTDSNSETEFTNLQYINFNLSSEDILVFNGRSFAGNENIYLTMADLATSNLYFYYYNKDAQTTARVMNATVLETALYYDGNGNGQIDGYYNETSGYFVLDESSGDISLGFISGDFSESVFQPIVDSNGNEHQYFLKVYYTKNPRSYRAPAGYDTSATAMVIPLFLSTITDSKALSELTTQQQSYRPIQAGYTRYSADAEAYSDSSLGKLMYGGEASARSYVDIPLGGDKSPVTYTIETTKDGLETKVYSWEPDYCGELLIDYPNPEPIYHEKNITGDSIAIAGEEPHWEKTEGSKGRGTLTLSDEGKAKVNAYLASFVGDTTFALAIQEEPDEPVAQFSDIQLESVTVGNVSAIPSGDYLANSMDGTGSPENAASDASGHGSMPEFENDLGITLPSTSFALGDYASIIMDGSSVGFSIGLPIISGEQEYGKKDDKTSGGQSQSQNTQMTAGEQFKNANEAMSTLKDFISDVRNGNGVNSFKDIMKDDSYNKAKKNKEDKVKEGVQSRGVSVSFSVALAIMFEYNPIDNTYYFKQASIAATASLEFTMQYRFTPVPLIYVYLKAGFELGLATGLSVERTAKESNRIVTNDWLYNVSGITSKGLGTTLDSGESACFIIDISDVRGFRLYMDGSVYMEILNASQAEEYKKDPNGYSGGYVLSGRLSSDGSDPAEVYLPDGKYRAYVVLTALETTSLHYAMEVSGAQSLVYWNGIQISPSGFIEVGAGIGIELLKFELYLRAQLGMQFTIGGYSEDAGSYQGAQMNNFDLALSMGFNITVLFFNYSMDFIGYYLHGEDTGAGSKWESKWGALSQAFGGDTNGSGSSLVSVSAPIDTSDTQRVAGDGSAARAYNPTDDDAPFQLSGYGTSGDGFKLMDGLSTGNSYKVFRVGDDNYMLYTQSRSFAENDVDLPQLVLSRVVLTGSDNEARLQSPNGVGTCLTVDDDNTGDLDYAYSVDGDVLTVVWTTYSVASGADEAVTTTEAAKRTIVKTASIDLSADSPAFTAPTVVSGTTTSGTFRFLPQQEGTVSIYAETARDSATNNNLLKAYLKAVYGLTDEEIESGETTNYDNATALYRWNYQSDLNSMYGSGSRLIAYTGSDVMTMDLAAGEVIENLETATINGKLYAAYSTVQYAYFKDGQTVAEADSDTDLAAIKRLYLRSVDSEEGWGTARLLQTVIDFDRCSSSSAFSMSDGIYRNGVLAEEQVDPYFSNLTFLNARLSGDDSAETVLLYEMGGNTWLIDQSGITSAANGGSFTVRSVFSQTEGTDAVIGSDSDGNLAVVYTAPMTASGSNALYVAWWDTNLNTWGTGNVLAMNHLQVYEDSAKFELTAAELEKAYLGQTTGNTEYDAYIKSLSGSALESAQGAMEQFTFSDLQITLAKTTDESGADAGEQLLVMTQGSLQALKESTITNPYTNETSSTVAPDGSSDVGFYAVSFGAGRQGIGQAALSLTDYDFTAGSKLSGSLTFTNTGTVAIRASSTEPAKVTLTASGEDGGHTIAEWDITESVPSGATVELYFRMNAPLTSNLAAGTVFSALICEDDEYISSSGGSAFSASTGALLTVEARPELQFENFTAKLTGISGDKAIIAVDMTVSNRGSEDAANTFIQFAYETASGDTEYMPLDITGSGIKVGDEALVQSRGVTDNDFSTGIIFTSGISAGYQRRIHGTLTVPLSCFRQDDISGLHMKAEIFSDADNTSLNNGLYTSAHTGEYCASNNVRTTELAQETFFSAASQISVALGNTLRLPVTFASSSATGAEIVVREIGDGTADWSSSFGILYFDEQSQTIVAAPGADTVGNTGVIQLEDLATNSIYSIAYRITDLGDGINIYKDDNSFTFYEADGTETDLTRNDQDWRFNENVPRWDGGATEGEAPMNNDTVYARTDGAYLTFTTVADTIKLWFDGEVTVSSSLSSSKTYTAKSSELTGSSYPFVIDFGNDTGATHTVRIRAEADTTLDRYEVTYADGTDPVQTDTDAPQIFWSRSFPDTASLKNGESVTLTCYVVDDSQLLQVTGIPDDTVINKTSERFWSFPVTVTENGLMTIKATDASGKTTTYPLRVDWFNSQVSEGAVGTAPLFSSGDVTLETEDGSPVTGPLAADEYPYIRSSYVLQPGETITVSRSGEAAFDPESDGRWKVTENGIYLVRVTAADGTWSQTVVLVDCIDDGTFTLSVQHDEAARSFTVSVGGDSATSLTVNGYSILGSGIFTYTLGGEYVISASNAAGRTVTSTVTVTVPLTIDDDAAAAEVCSAYGKEDGKISLSLSGIHGGGYDAGVSRPTVNSYEAVYTAALLAVDGEDAAPDAEAVEQASWISADAGEFLFDELASGWYQLLVRDSVGNMLRKNIFVDARGPLVVVVPDDGDDDGGESGRISFTDVPESAYYYDAVIWAVKTGITVGTSETTFSPDDVCTRAQIVTFLWRAAGSPAPEKAAMPFTDVAADSYYYDAVLWAVENGITAGTSETTFSPDAKCSRAQAVTFLWRAAGCPDIRALNPFSDVTAKDYYYNAVMWAIETGITVGTGSSTFSPNIICTRAQIVTFLYRSAK